MVDAYRALDLAQVAGPWLHRATSGILNGQDREAFALLRTWMPDHCASGLVAAVKGAAQSGLAAQEVASMHVPAIKAYLCGSGPPPSGNNARKGIQLVMLPAVIVDLLLFHCDPSGALEASPRAMHRPANTDKAVTIVGFNYTVWWLSR